MKQWSIILLVTAAACGGEAPGPSVAKARTAPANNEAASPSQSIYADMTVVDLEGRPLAGMMPIATLNANAFDRPVASGALTDEKGHSTFVVPRQNQRVFLRAWDPELKYFPNNFYEMPVAEGSRTAPLRISMVAAARLEARLVDAQGRPLANTVADLMLSHPTQGPWWPDRARTDIAGRIAFARVPPGEYTIQIEAQGAGMADMPKTFLPPARTTDLGDVTVR